MKDATLALHQFYQSHRRSTTIQTRLPKLFTPFTSLAPTSAVARSVDALEEYRSVYCEDDEYKEAKRKLKNAFNIRYRLLPPEYIIDFIVKYCNTIKWLAEKRPLQP